MQEPKISDFESNELKSIRHKVNIAKSIENRGFSGMDRWRDKESIKRQKMALEKEEKRLVKQCNEKYIEALEKYIDHLNEQEAKVEKSLKLIIEYIKELRNKTDIQ